MRSNLPVIQLTQKQLDATEEFPKELPTRRQIGVRWKRKSMDDPNEWLVGEYFKHPTQGIGTRHCFVQIVENAVLPDSVPARRDPGKKLRAVNMRRVELEIHPGMPGYPEEVKEQHPPDEDVEEKNVVDEQGEEGGLVVEEPTVQEETPFEFVRNYIITHGDDEAFMGLCLLLCMGHQQRRWIDGRLI